MSAVDLHPAEFAWSEALDVSGEFQVGLAYNSEVGGDQHAILWHGSAAGAIDIHPAGFSNSLAVGISGASQVGYGYSSVANGVHALLWNGTAASAVDRHPAGFDGSRAYGVSAAGQVGSAYGPSTNSGHGHAILWTGTAATALDIHPFLANLGPSFTNSVAFDIDDSGSIVGYARDKRGTLYAVLWTPVPEPASCTLLACGLAIASFTRARRRH